MQCHFFVFQWGVPVSDVLLGTCQVIQIITLLVSLSLGERNGEAPRSQTEERVSEEPRRDGERAEGSAEGRRGNLGELGAHQSLEIREQGTEMEESEKQCGEGKVGLWKNNSIPLWNWIKCLWHEKWLLNKNLHLWNTQVQTPVWDFLISAWAICWILMLDKPSLSTQLLEQTRADFRTVSNQQLGMWMLLLELRTDTGKTDDGWFRRNRKIKYTNAFIVCFLSSALCSSGIRYIFNIIFNVRVEWINKIMPFFSVVAKSDTSQIYDGLMFCASRNTDRIHLYTKVNLKYAWLLSFQNVALWNVSVCSPLLCLM